MASPFHHLQTEVEGNHVPYNWVYANSVARTGATGFIASDVGKLALQSDDFSLWILSAITPTWVSLSGSSVAAFTDLTDVPGSFAGAGGQAVAVNVGETALEFIPFPSGNLHETEDAVTATVTDVVTLSHNSSGTPSDGFGTGISVLAETDTTPDTPIGGMNWFWRDATHASRLGEFELFTYDGANQRPLIRIAVADIGTVTPNAIGLGAVDLMPDKAANTDVPAADSSFLGGGSGNNIGASAYNGVIVGGASGAITGTSPSSGIIGGLNNAITNGFSGIVAGQGGSIAAVFSGILGGDGNTITSGGSYGGAVGGENNTISNTHSGIVGGYNNNIISNPYSFVGGGTAHFVGGGHAAVVGGNDNLVYGQYAFVGAGIRNQITATGVASVAFGTGTLVETSRTLALGGGEFNPGTRGETQFLVTPVNRLVTHSSAAWFELFVDGTSERLLIPNNVLWTFLVLISGTTAGAAKTFSFKIEGAIENDGGVTTLLASTVTTIYDADDISFDARVTADDTNDALLVEVSDSDGASDSVRWFATVLRSSVTAI